MTNPAAPKRFSREEFEAGCIDAFMTGRVYNKGGEKESPNEIHEKMLARSVNAARATRRRRKKENRNAR